MSEDNNRPYWGLGKKIKTLREAAKETVAEVSGAVEIETEKLVEIEIGKTRPSEDILLLLISHFEIEDSEAVSLWESAGYGKDETKLKVDTPQQPPVLMVAPFDNRIMYSDKVDLSVNDAGVVLNFKQGDDAGQSIAKIGMSKQQALATLELLTRALFEKPAPVKLLPKSAQKSITDEHGK